MTTHSTNSLDAIVYPTGNIKLIVYARIRKSEGWTKRELRKSFFGVPAEEFTIEYVKGSVKEVFVRFPDQEIKELLTKLNK